MKLVPVPDSTARVPARSNLAPQVVEMVDRLEAHFGQPVLRIKAPGGKSRASLRAEFADLSVIVTHRASPNLARRETLFLQALEPHSDDLPRYLGCSGPLLFQSDAGSLRLSQAAARAGADRQTDLAADAVAAIFRLHGAARKTALLGDLPHLGASPEWIRAVVDGVADLARHAGCTCPNLDHVALCERIAQPAAQVLKWDCRAGNAALDLSGRLRWFDFEHAGARHGAEDFAWLIGDESWPVPAEHMLDIVRDGFDTGAGHSRADYLSYLAFYTTFHTIQRILLIVAEARNRGWVSRAHALRYDKVGTHPAFGVAACRTAAVCADLNPATRSFVPMLDSMQAVFAARSGGAVRDQAETGVVAST